MGQLTATKIKTLTEPGRYIDGEGLMMEIAPGGSRSWKLRVRVDGKRRDFGLGSLSILTAARSGEIRGATWSEFDLAKALWSIPATRMKMGRPHFVPLAPQVLDALTCAKAFSAPCTDLVFPGMKRKTPMFDMTLLKILRDMATGTTVHGFRSAFRDWVADMTNYPGQVAEAALAHANSNKVEAAYRRTDFLKKRKTLMAEWVAYCCRG